MSNLVPRLIRWFVTHVLNLNVHKIWRDPTTGVYMYRYHAGQDFRTQNWFVHNIRLADEDGHHNHPYEWQASFIFCRRYTEETLDTRTGKIVTRKRRWFNWIPGDRYHRITEVDKDGEVWTLFVHGPKHGDSWGFWDHEHGHIHNEEYNRESSKTHLVFIPRDNKHYKRGWYFGDETGWWHGPYASREECKKQFDRYCEEYL